MISEKLHKNISKTIASDYLSFQDILASATNLPPPGPAYYAARREIWLTPTNPSHVRSTELSISRHKLENLLSPPGAVSDDGVWKAGVEKVWKGLSAGGKLKRRLPLNLVMKIIHCAWLHDPDIWPPGAVIPDDIWDDVSPNPMTMCPPSRTPIHSSGVTTPWTTVSNTAVNDRQASGLVVLGSLKS